MLDSPASRDQVDNGNNQSDHKQKMNQAASHMESPAQKPKDDEDCENRPKHRYPFKIGNSVSQPPKGEKQRFRTELSLKDMFSGKLDARPSRSALRSGEDGSARRQVHAGRKDFSYQNT